MNTSEQFKPSFSQYFIVHYSGSTSIAYKNASSYSALQREIKKLADKSPALDANKIDNIEAVQYSDSLLPDIEIEMIELQSLLDFSMKGLSPIFYDEEDGLIPLLYQLHELKSKMMGMIAKVEKQSKFYEKDPKAQTSN